MMRIIQLASFEFRRQRQPLQRLAIAFLLVVPLLYGALYLWSNCDPYGRTGMMPVALVNDDQPVRAAGTTVNAGGMFVSALRRDRIFDWHFTTAADAGAGLRDGRYEISILVPRDFSASLASGAAGTPRRAMVAMRVDDGNGYLIEIIARTVKDQITQRVDQAATTAYFESVYGSLGRLRNGLVRARNAQILGSPARVTLTAAHPATVYGRGLAPFFFSIALWVFGIAAFLVLRPISGRMLAGRVTAAVAAWLPVFTIGAAGGLILLAAVQIGLGLGPVHPGWTIAVIILAAATFTALAHMLRLAAGVVGSAITLVLLMLQLTPAAAIYPVQTLPAFFRVLHPVLPMTYLVDGLRITLTGGYGPHLARGLLILTAYGLAALGGTTLLVARRRTWTLRQLHPVLGA